VEPQQEFKDAVRANDVEAVQRLLQDPNVDPTADKSHALLWASYQGFTDVVRVLLQDPRVDPSVREQIALSYASEYGRLPVVQMLLQDPRVDPSAEDQRPLKGACCMGRTDVVKLLLQDPRVDPSAENQKALQNASGRGHKDIVKILLKDPRVDPTALENEALLAAAKEEKLAVVHLLLQDPRVQRCEYIYEWANEPRTRWSKKLKNLFAEAKVRKAKQNIQKTARNTLALQMTERQGFKDLPNNVTKYLGTFLSGKVGPTLQSHMNQLKTNHNAIKKTRKRKKRE
jgi:hypothetical protein